MLSAPQHVHSNSLLLPSDKRNVTQHVPDAHGHNTTTFLSTHQPTRTHAHTQDLIHILEVDLGLGPLRASQKNSVAVMVDWLLSQ